MNREELKTVADALTVPRKGILAADETVRYMEERFGKLGLETDCETRRRYRQMLFSSESLADCISGVILAPETIDQRCDSGESFPQFLAKAGILAGVNVDSGLTRLSACPEETITEGLDGLGPRCVRYRRAGCLFAKLRCSYKIGPNRPSDLAIEENARLLARYAAICQTNGLVPIVEPDIAREGDFTVEDCRIASEKVLSCVYYHLHRYNVYLEGTVLKVAMVLHGSSCNTPASVEDIGSATVQVMERTVPVAVPGIGFLSGGQSAKDSVAHLKAINKYKKSNRWALTFIYGRALQENVAEIWSGNDSNVKAAQTEFLKLVQQNSRATQA